MEGEGGRHRHPGRVQDAVVEHALSALPAFLARLEHEYDVPGKPRGVVGEHLGGTDEHGRVQVVSAGMHHALRARGVAEAGLLVHREGVHVGPQQDGTTRRAGVRAAVAAQHRGQGGRAGARGDVEWQMRECVDDGPLRPREVETCLRSAVQPTAEAHQAFLE